MGIGSTGGMGKKRGLQFSVCKVSLGSNKGSNGGIWGESHPSREYQMQRLLGGNMPECYWNSKEISVPSTVSMW